ncbi:TetR/AcrR family transcriptional regulator, partial [candidate division CSSED10-310 bacterium]
MNNTATGKNQKTTSRSDKILAAARSLFFQNGYRGSSMQMIASQAGYSKRTVYLDYLNKDELFMTLCAEGGQLLLSQLQEIPLHEIQVQKGFEQTVAILMNFSRRHNEYFRMIFSEA